MQPKKDSSFNKVLYVILLVLIMYMAIQLAYCFSNVDALIYKGSIEDKDRIISIFNELTLRIDTEPFSFEIVEETQRFVMYGLLAWVLTIAYFASSKKNYIHGKEYGTARWGNKADIKSLFASSIEKQEISDLAKRRTPWGRWLLRHRIIKRYKAEGKRIEKELLEDREFKAAELKELKDSGIDITSYPPIKSKEEIKAEVNELIEDGIKEEWKPIAYKEEYEKRISEIDNSPLYSDDDERKKQYEIAKTELKEKNNKFYKSANEKIKIKAKYHNMDMLLTDSEKISFINKQSINMNTLIVGGSGTGKTRGYVMPNLLQAHTSYVFTDPKGEILEKGGYFLEKEKGYKVRALDLVDKSKSACFNPIAYLHPERPGYEERVIALVETIMLNTDGGEKKEGTDPFWPKAERMFLQALLYAIPKAFKKEEQMFGTMLELIHMLEIKDSSKEDRNSDLDIFFREYKERIKEEDFAYRTYSEFRKKAPDKTGNSVLMSVLARMQPFRGKEIQRILSDDDMQLDRVGEEKTAIFIIVPPTDKTFSFVSGMLFTTLFQEIQYSASVVHRHDGQRLPVPVRLILDEFANTCVIPNFVQLLSYARSFGVGMTVILQSLEQIKNAYEKEWGVIVDNCSSFLYLGGVRHIDTLNYIRDLIGKGTFDKRTTGRTRGRHGSSSTNEDVVGRNLKESDEISKLHSNECILFVTGRPPFLSKKYEYTKHPNYRFTSDGNSRLSYEHHPVVRPHGEDESEMRAEDKVKNSSHSTQNDQINYEDIVFDIDINNAVRRLAKNINEYELIPDDELKVWDGEDDEADVEMSFEQIVMSAEKNEFKLTPSENILKPNEEVKDSLERLLKNADKYELITDDEYRVYDGENDEDAVNSEFIKMSLDKFGEENDDDAEKKLKSLCDSLKKSMNIENLDNTVNDEEKLEDAI